MMGKWYMEILLYWNNVLKCIKLKWKRESIAKYQETSQN